jgi:hypothetical protein
MVDEKKEIDVITQAHIAAERLERANRVNEELVRRMEALESRRVLGGQAMAGSAPERELSPEEKLRIDTANYFKGSALDGVLK